MQFRWEWRPYQERVLGNLERHLGDKKLHIVAAPGSGKTCLGLEVFRRLNSAALVLSPTRTIRDQWLNRLSDFLPAGSAVPPQWSSNSLDDPRLITSITYQALHTRHRASTEAEEEREDPDALEAPSRGELKEVAVSLRQHGVRTLILDEAHHLRREWWEALGHLVEELPDVRVVSLTATPPYDVVGAEWQRYEQLCGPIDEQISVPELVRAGTLSPHQDYVYAVSPSSEDTAAIQAYDGIVRTVRDELLRDAEFLCIVENHPWVAQPQAHLGEILDDPELLSALLIYLRACGRKPPWRLLNLLGCRAEDLPAFDRRWCQVLVQRYLREQAWPLGPEAEKHREALAKRLRATGLLWRRELRLEASIPIRNLLRQTASKIGACVDIYRLESQLRGESLRQVILTDFIRDDASEQLGACPVFYSLLQQVQDSERAGFALLTGRLAVLHETRLPELREALVTGAGRVRAEPLSVPNAAGFLSVTLEGNASRLVDGFTRLLGRGRIRLLIGTRALLGEGWDAPAINSLVLASYVGSYVLSNQMRGRALRTDLHQPGKVSSIWHIVAIDVKSQTGMADFEELDRRFHTFVGLAERKQSIEANLERLALPDLSKPGGTEAVNKLSARRLQDFRSVAQRWASAIERGEDGRVLPCVTAEPLLSLKRLLFRNTLKYLVVCAFSTGLTVAAYVTKSFQTDSLRMLLTVGAIAGLLGLIVAGPKFIRAAFLWLRCLPVDGSLRQLAMAVRGAMIETGLMETDPHRLEIRSREMGPGEFSISLIGGTYLESNLFADTLEEVLGPIENPRYLLTRRSAESILPRKDYHAVPAALATDKERAAIFQRHWERRLGPAELIYTRSEEGRRQLLKARAKSFSTAFQPRARRLDQWH